METISTRSPAIIKRKNQKRPYNQSDAKRESAIQISQHIANYYIPYYLRNTYKQESLKGLPKGYLIPPAQPSDISIHVAKICTQLEETHSKFFENIPVQINITAENAKCKFLKVSSEIITDKIVWGRLLTVYTLAGVFAAHLVNKGQIHIVPKIPLWIAEFIDDCAADWIVENGGWDSLHDTDGSWSSLLTVGMLAAAGLFFYGFRNFNTVACLHSKSQAHLRTCKLNFMRINDFNMA